MYKLILMKYKQYNNLYELKILFNILIIFIKLKNI